MNYQAVRDNLILDEGVRLKPYTDSAGKLTIGIGRNLDDDGISKEEALVLLDNDIQSVIRSLDTLLPWWRGMSDVRQRVLINMAFNVGIVGLMGFKKALAAMESGDFNAAANEMQNSPWYTEVHGRAIRLVSLMRNGQ